MFCNYWKKILSYRKNRKKSLNWYSDIRTDDVSLYTKSNLCYQWPLFTNHLHLKVNVLRSQMFTLIVSWLVLSSHQVFKGYFYLSLGWLLNAGLSVYFDSFLDSGWNSNSDSFLRNFVKMNHCMSLSLRLGKKGLGIWKELSYHSTLWQPLSSVTLPFMNSLSYYSCFF